MKGTHHVIIQNKRIHYEFDIRRNITVIKGDSASGKTTLVEMIQEYMDQGSESMITIQSDKRCGVISGNTWKGQLAEFSDSLIFIDEGNRFVLTDEFSKIIQQTDNYYIIVSRESLPNLPYSVDEIYGIHQSGKYGSLKKCYQEFYRIYEKSEKEVIKPDIVVTEDSNSGNQFFNNVCDKVNKTCLSAGGKTNILGELKKVSTDKVVLVIADGAAFGSEMDVLVKFAEARKNIKIYLPESFEWILLSSGIIKSGDIDDILKEPDKYIESQEFFSWERFFTHLLIEQTKNTYLKYNKSELNKAYTQGQIKKNIVNCVKKTGIELEI